MSEVRLVVREAERDWSGTVHGSDADRAVAALSADPVTLDELEAAVARFGKRDAGRRYFSNLRRGLDDEPHDAGLVVIDLVARLVVVESTYSSPGRDGYVAYHDGRCATEIDVRYHLARDWAFRSDSHAWKHTADTLRRDRAAHPPQDVRAVVYGRPMIEFLARQAFAAFARRDEIAAAVRAEWRRAARERLAENAGIPVDEVDESLLTDDEIAPRTWSGQERYADVFYDALRDIHAAWLMTPCDDLGGRTPREAALDRRDHLTWDLQDRAQQWSAMLHCPPGLADSSHAYRYAGFGTHELVKYYDLVRELLWSCWERLAELAQSPETNRRPDAMTVGDFLTTEVLRLEKIRDSWLDTPDDECHGRTPRSIIDRERARLPEGVSGCDAMIDADCPCCQMLADMPGPMFWHLDGSGMDDDFAFDIYCRTREEWDAERRRWAELDRKFDAERAERKRLGVNDSFGRADEQNAVWSRSFVVGDTADVPVGVRVFGIGCRLAELIVALRGGADRESTSPETQRQIEQLNRDFGNLREVLQNADSSLSEALLEPVAQRFRETLDAIAASHPDQEPRCASLAESLQALLDPPPPRPEWEPGDADFPF